LLQFLDVDEALAHPTSSRKRTPPEMKTRVFDFKFFALNRWRSFNGTE